jgi:glycosyltransferase involved in cell wall biosynthesis
MESEPMLRIAIASGVRGDTRRYRTFHLYEQCCLLGLNTQLTHVMSPDFQPVVHDADLLVLHRSAWDPNIQRAIDIIHGRGGKVIYDTDDLLFDPAVFKWIDSPDFLDPVRAKLYQEDMERHWHSMKLCDAIMTSTAYLAVQAKGAGLPVYVHRNAYSKEMLVQSDRATEISKRDGDAKIIIGYASGTPTHNRDFETIGPAVRTLLDKSKQVVLWLVGPIKLDRAWFNYRSRILHLPHVPWRLLPAYLARFDINLAPLVSDNPFSQSKSEIKWMEAALVKTPTIASKTDAYQSVIRSGSTGIVASSLKEWQEALTRMIGDSDKRQAMGAAAREAAIQSHSPQVRANEFRLVLQQVTGRIIRPVGAGKISPLTKTEGNFHGGYDSRQVSRLEKTPTLITMAGYSLRYRGVGTLIKQIWVFFRRLMSPLMPYKKHKTEN